MRIKSRLDRLESSQGTFGEVLGLIRRGTYYDELTDEQRRLYAAYKATTPEALEAVEKAVIGNLHFPLMANATADTIAETAAEIEKQFFDCTAP